MEPAGRMGVNCTYDFLWRLTIVYITATATIIATTAINGSHVSIKLSLIPSQLAAKYMILLPHIIILLVLWISPKRFYSRTLSGSDISFLQVE